jgi:hypothetical protein
VHPFRPVLAPGVARRNSSAAGLASVTAVATCRQYRGRSLCFDSSFVVPSCAIARVEKDLAVMRLTFERDIPEFKNKTRRERSAMYGQATKLDKRIWLRAMLTNLIFVPVLSALMELRKHDYLPSLSWVFFIYFAVGIPVVILLRAWWVNPLIKNAIQACRTEGPEDDPGGESMRSAEL